MSQEIFHIQIKKEYAADVIKDLLKMDAVEVVDENNFSLPEWHQQLVIDELKRITDNPALLKDWGTVKKELNIS